MKTGLLNTIFFLFVFTATSSLTAQDMAADFSTEPASTNETAEKEAEEEDKAIKISGFVDAYYQYSFNENPFPTSFTETHNSFTLGMANVVFAKEGKVGFVADLAFGPRADVANGFTENSTLGAIKQLYVTYSPSDKLTFTFGNYGTHVGYEVIDAPANVNYSTSYMFSNGPFYHTGVKADIALSENFGAMLGIFNDTDGKFDFVDGKHIGAQLSYSKDDFEVYLNYIGGKDAVINEGTTESADIRGDQVDITATYQVNDQFGLGFNGTTKIVSNSELDDNTSWLGAALYANYAVNDALTLGIRGEYIGDDDGLISGVEGNSIIDLTLSGNINVGSLKIIPEFRVDIASEDSFLDADGNLSGTSSAFILAVVYGF